MAGDHPENDLSEFCDQDQIKQYQSIVGQLIWLSGLGRFHHCHWVTEFQLKVWFISLALMDEG